MRKISPLIFFILIVQILFAQEKTITRNYPYIKSPSFLNLPDKTVTARDKITFKPGFSHSAKYHRYDLTAKVNSEIICNVDYQDEKDGEAEQITTSLPVGSTSGSHNITNTGALNYSIPIDIPVGTAGMQPNLALTYNSQAGNGLLGYGWNLAGLSSISKLSSNIYYDGVYSGNNDKLALDGKRMIYEDVAAYYVEDDPFTKILKAGTDLNTSFIVKTKDGKTLYYGHREDNKIIGDFRSGDHELSWMLGEVKDHLGNSYVINYHSDNDKGEYYPEEILYTINESKGLDAFCKIKFFYESRIDKQKYYTDERGIIQDKVLYKIEIWQNDKLYKKYEFSYVDNSYSFLNEVTEFDSNGSQLNSTILNWKGIETLDYETNFNLAEDEFKSYPADFNGDGKTDLFVIYETPNDGDDDFDKWELYITEKSNNQLILNKVDNGTLPSSFQDIILTDQNKDGVTDILFQSYKKVTWQVCYDSNGDPCDPNASNPLGHDDFAVNRIIEDPNPGDCFCNGYYRWDMKLENYVYQNNSLTRNPSKDITVYAGNSSSRNKMYVYSLDFNADGAMELLILDDKHNFQHIIGLNAQIDPDFFGDDNYIDFTDLNGNGLIEIFTYSQTGNMNAYEYNHSTQDFIHIRANTTVEEGSIPYLGDFNGDGKTDLLLRKDYDWKIYYRNYDRWDQGVDIDIFDSSDLNLPFIENPYDFINYQVIDLNNDNKDDIIVNFMYPSFEQYYSYTVYTIAELSIGEGFKTFKDDLLTSGEYDLDLTSRSNFLYGDFDGNGVKDVAGIRYDNIVEINSLSNSFPKYLSKVTNGMQNTVKFNYSTLADASVHTKDNNAVFPILDIQTPIRVVSNVLYENSLGGTESMNYFYQGAKVHVHGKGFLGFSKLTTSNSINNASTVTSYSLDTDRAMFELSKTVNKIGTEVISESDYVINKKIFYDDKCFFSYASSVVSQDYIKGFTVTKTNTVDNSGNLTNVLTAYSDGNSKNINTTYVARNGESLLSLPKLVTQTGTIDGDIKEVQTEYWYNGNDLLNQKIDFKDSETKQVTTDYTYDDFGNILSTKIDDILDEDPRTEAVEYDNTHRFVKKRTNALNKSTYMEYDSFGNITESKDPNNLVTKFKYDNQGRLTQKTLPTGVSINYSIGWANGQGPENALYYSKQESSGEPKLISYFDKHSKKLQTEVETFDGSKLITKYVYDKQGRVVQQSIPYKAGQDPNWNTVAYDEFGRVTDEDGVKKDITYVYDNNTVTKTDNIKNVSVESTYNAMNLVKTVTDLGGTLTYTYNGAGLNTNIAFPDGNIVLEYDEQGNKTKLIDPNAGTTIYNYNGYGKLVSQTDARGNTSIIEYDKLGRIVSKTPNNGSPSVGYIYDTGFFGTLPSEIQSDGAANYYTYDEYGRMSTVKEEIPDGNSGKKEFNYSYTYDDLGRVNQITYPSGFKIAKSYNQYGFENKITAPSSGTVIWQANTVNDFGMIDNYSLGSGINVNYAYNTNGELTNISAGSVFSETYDYYNTGNLKSRDDNFSPKETFVYDDLNRLTSAQVQGSTEKIISYALNGNITSKTGVGSFKYDGDSGKPHALDYTSENNSISADLQDVEYNYFNSISRIKENNHEMVFSYGLSQNRNRVDYSYQDSKVSSKFYSGLYERTEKETGEITELSYITSPTGIIGVVINDANGERFNYIHKDMLGSYRVLTNESGQIVDKTTFDAWGNRIDPVTRALLAQNTSVIDRGFTGHEHMNAFSLINMNGRVYDPVLGRFMQVDNNISFPGFTQNYNRYAYALNNPLMFTDLDGETPLLAAAIIGAFVNIMVNDMQGNINSDWDYLTYGLIGAASGVAGGAVGGAFSTVGSGFIGGAVSGAAGGAAGGFVSGAGNAWVSGAGLDEGLVAGLTSAGMGAITGGVVGGISGGISATRHGGNFWTGKHATYDYILKPGPSNEALAEYMEKYNEIADGDTELLQLNVKDEFGVKTGDMGITDITTKGDPSTYGFDPRSGLFYRLDKGYYSGGYYQSEGMFSGSVHISQSVAKSYFSDIVRFRAIVGHELIHAYHNYSIPFPEEHVTEKVAYQFTHDTYFNAGRYNEAVNIMNRAKDLGFWGDYSSFYDVKIPSPFSYSIY